MVCRSTSTTLSQSCASGNDGGQQLRYDALRRLISWQNAPGASPTASQQYAYDGAGNRVWQQAQSVSGSPSTTTTTYYYGGQLRIALAVNGPNSGKASLLDKILAGADLLVNVVMDVTSVVGAGRRTEGGLHRHDSGGASGGGCGGACGGGCGRDAWKHFAAGTLTRRPYGLRLNTWAWSFRQ